MPDPPLDDGVVTLRPWSKGDVPALIECVDGDEEIARWLDAVPQPYREAEAQAWVDQATSWWYDGTSAPFAVTESDTGRVLGSVGFGWIGDQRNGEVGYWMRRDARGRGLTTRALAPHLPLGARRARLRAAPASGRSVEPAVAACGREGRLHA